MFLALELSATLDLSQYSRLLWQHKLSHQIVTQAERQLVLVAQQEQIHQAYELFQRWQAGEVMPLEQSSGGLGGYLKFDVLQNSFLGGLLRAPLTMVLIVVCVVLAVLAPLDAPNALTFAMLYPNFSLGTGTIVLTRVWQSFGVIQLLKMLSPILLHGGLMHLAFNMMWLWELGRRIERVQRSLSFAAAIVVVALFSNTIQYLWGGGNNFGGMSGVVYGLFGYIGCWQFLDPRKGLALPMNLIVYMLLMLALFTWLNLEMIANAAHLGGFLTGVVYGAIVAVISRLRRNDARAGL